MTNAVLLKIALVRKNVTVLELCRECGISASYYYKCTRGEQDFRTAEVKAICDYLHIAPDEMAAIFFGSNVDK